MRADEDQVLSPEFEAWVVDNLLRGCEPLELIDELAAFGVDRAIAEREVARILSSPAARQAATLLRRSRRLEQVLRLRRALEADTTEVARIRKPDAAAFYEGYYRNQRPVVIEGAMDDWPALTRWSLPYFREGFGEVGVRVCLGRTDDPRCDANYQAHSREMPLGEYIDRIETAGESNDLYMISRNRTLELPEMAPLLDDIRYPPYLDPAKTKGWMSLWLGPAGTVTPLHHDKNNILFCQVLGRKRVSLISPLELDVLDSLTGVYSAIDPEDPSSLGEAHAEIVELGPGDSLFIPVGYYHHVRALSPSASMAFTGFRWPNHYNWYCPGNS